MLARGYQVEQAATTRVRFGIPLSDFQRPVHFRANFRSNSKIRSFIRTRIDSKVARTLQAKRSLNDGQKVRVREHEGEHEARATKNISILHDTAGKARTAGANKSVQAGRKPGYEEDEGEPTVGVFINGSVKRDHPSGAISFHQSLISLLRVVQHLVTPGGTLTAPQEVLMKTNLTQNGGHTYFLLRLSLSLPALFFSPLSLCLSTSYRLRSIRRWPFSLCYHRNWNGLAD